jgi:hypothetical protein
MDLTRRWGGMPYLYAPMSADGNMDLVRLSMQETYELAAKDCDSAAMFLRNVIPNIEFQYPTRIAALAMKSRLLLYAASTQARTEDHPTNPHENLWEQAALAANEALKEAEAAGYRLVEWGAELNGDEGYYYIFKDNNYVEYPKEVLFGRRAQIGWTADSYTQCIRPPGQLGGTTGAAANHLLVDCFEMKATGLPIDDNNSGYYDQNPYAGRDPRFYFNIMYNQAKVMDRTMQIYQFDETTEALGSQDCVIGPGGNPNNGFTRTGYYAKKWLGKTFGAALPQIWPYMRLAEVYLNFAEAANEAWNDPAVKHSNCKYSAEEALNKVRERAEMPGIHSKFLNQNAFRQRIRNERRVELCFEEHRLFDIRRWLIATQPENRDIWRMRITKLAPGYDQSIYPTGFRYLPEFYAPRTFENRHYLFVIDVNDTRMGSNFKQNPGW